ncbi:MAG: hypothetical protein MUF58_01500 [Arcicella sp.]|jgi:hypothetical protein|nr:hypothetical protein [Arcicella sp.]
MKTIKKEFKILAMVLLLGLNLMSCHQSEQLIDSPASNIKSEKSTSEYVKLLNARTNFKGYPFDILEIKRNDNLLKITVEGGCDTQAYRIIWDGVINFTEPANPNMVLSTTNLIISHEPVSQVQCLAVMKHTIEVDLKLLLGAAYKPNIHIVVSNASKIDDKSVEPNGSVTTIKK